MFDFRTYNTRGLNNKQQFVKDFISANKISLLALVETKVKDSLADSISRELHIILIGSLIMNITQMAESGWDGIQISGPCRCSPSLLKLLLVQ